MNRTTRTAMITAIIFLFLTVIHPYASAKVTIKLATVAPGKSTWAKVFKGMAEEINQLTKGEVEFIFYFGSQKGDEQDMVTKMKQGQIDAASITTAGLSQIAPSVLVLQLPFLITKYKQLDCIREKMKDRFNKILEDAGFKLLGWGDMGFVYIFSAQKVKTKADLQKTKLWNYSSDPIGRTLAKAADIEPITLGLTDVMPALQTGKIDAVYNSPYGMVAVGWFTKVKYMADLPLAIGIGATVISMKKWKEIPPEYQKIIEEVAEKYHFMLTKKIRTDNKKAVESLVQGGIEIVEISDEEKKTWEALAMKSREILTGTLFDKALLDEVLENLKTCP